MVLELIRKFSGDIRRASGTAELVEVLRRLAQSYGADGAILIDYAPDHRSLRTLVDTNPARAVVARRIVETLGVQASLDSLRRILTRGPVVRVTGKDLPPEHPYRRFWLDLWFGEALVVPVSEDGDVAGALVLTGRSMTDNLREVALSHLGYVLIDHLRHMQTHTSARGRLSPRELEVLRMSSDGLTSKEIGEQLGISMRTVNAHVDHAIAKLGMRNRMQAVVELGRRGLLRAGSEMASDDDQSADPTD